MTHVVLEGLGKRYANDVVALDGLTLGVERGEFLALLGPSGCGKTTCLRLIAGLLEPTTGTVRVAGADVTRLPVYQRNMGFVFQNYALFPHMDVAGNVAFGLEMRAVAREARAQRVAEALRLVRLEGYERRRPRELSGGQQQRVALARALVVRPDVLLLDESLSNLDAKLREQMRREIREIQRTLAITTIFVTHDQVEALTMCDRIAVLSGGRLAQVGTPEDVYERPASRFVADFVGRANTMRGEIEGADRAIRLAGGVRIRAERVPDGARDVDVLVRPHRLVLAAPEEETRAGENALAGRVVARVYVGDVAQLELDTPAGRLLVEVGTRGDAWRVAPGALVQARWSTADTLVFAAAAA